MERKTDYAAVGMNISLIRCCRSQATYAASDPAFTFSKASFD